MLLVVLFHLPFYVFLLYLAVILCSARVIRNLRVDDRFRFGQVGIVVVLFLRVRSFARGGPEQRGNKVATHRSHVSFLGLRITQRLIRVNGAHVAPIPTRHSRVAAPRRLTTRFRLQVRRESCGKGVIKGHQRGSRSAPFERGSRIQLRSVLATFIRHGVVKWVHGAIIRSVHRRGAVQGLSNQIEYGASGRDDINPRRLRLILRL